MTSGAVRPLRCKGGDGARPDRRPEESTMSGRVTHPSVEAMLEPSVLGGLLGRPVGSVALRPMKTAGWSSTESVFEAVVVDGETTPAAVLKRIRWSRDWHAIATEDSRGRELAIWESGVLDRLPPGMGHAVRGAARFEDGAALLMDDLTRHLVPQDTDVRADEAMGVLAAMAAMHATFWQDPPIDELGAATCRLERLITRISETSLRQLGRVLPDNEMVATFPDGWARLPSLIDPGVARDLQALADDPAPIVAVLEGYPTTLLHGDLRVANVAWDGTRAIAFDWQPTVAPPAFDLAYFVWSLWVGSPLHPDEAMARYRDMLAAALGPGVSWSWWDDQLDVCIAAVVTMMASPDALSRADDHDPRRHPPWTSHLWWVERATRGLRLIDAT